jgi:branched-chain amino acid transport system substrate-binding protein
VIHRIVRISITLILFASLVACGEERPAGEKPITIGAVLPLTGEAATFGQNAARGAQLAVSEANARNETPQFVLKTEDSRGNPAEAVSAARKLIEADGAVALIGDVTSGGTHAIIPLITETETPLISPSASDPELSGASEFFARVWPSDVYEASVIAAYAKNQGLLPVALVYANNDYGVAMAEEFEKQLGKDGVSLKVPVDRETLDYRPVIQRLKFRRPSALMMVLYPEDALRFLQQMDEQGLALPTLATATFEDPQLLSAPGAERVVFASPLPPSDDDAARRSFVSSYKERYGEDPGVLSDTGYDSAKLLIEAILQVGAGNSRSVIERIKSMEDYAGTSGKLTFEPTGDVVKEYRLRTVRDGSFVWLEEPTRTEEATETSDAA